MINFAFNLQKDKDWRESSSLQLFKIVNLWDMLTFKSRAFLLGSQLIGGMCTAVPFVHSLKACLKQFNFDYSAINLHEIEEQLPDVIRELLEAFRDADLGYAVKRAERLLEYVNLPPDQINNDTLKQMLGNLMEMIVDEFDERTVLVVPPSSVKLYENSDTFLGSEIIEEARFALLIRDASEAGNCFALGRYTACVFHLMRIAEFMNQQFAKELGIIAIQTKKGPVALEDADWRIIYDHINNHVNGAKNQPCMPNKALREKCNNLLSIIGPLREVRNPLMHSPGDFYTEENAEIYMKCIASFINQFRVVFSETDV